MVFPAAGAGHAEDPGPRALTRSVRLEHGIAEAFGDCQVAEQVIDSTLRFSVLFTSPFLVSKMTPVSSFPQ